ncbi:hypothetical protein PQC65_gp047 [Aeromonas phage pAEv1810]|uniref:hypothetical protein n=1 Tax=Aeromonas phage pAEv1810 TaxID=2908744 RepID=UPI00232959E5|nr:hypothetical protein PQC65_gp047 [Aeromonas phage pAEv1810]UIS24985.1 hypothetical protein pAEv1810_47 [Aeromonas phage pAEv1810]
MKDAITNYLVKQSIGSDITLQKGFLLNDSGIVEHETNLNDNFYLHMVKGETRTIVSLVKRNPEQAITIGSFCNFRSVNDKMEWLIDSMSYYVFNCVMKDLKIEHYLNKDHLFTENDYNKLNTLIGKNVVIKINTKHWNKWCLGLLKTLQGKFIKGELLQDVKVILI